ncbi:cytochrome P460 family protein [Trichlorobacter lovleyi]|uniref:cytochrome P460 family protein n=1 Tax=Trichlorobacter lovleyi TaxID=313985 RepID=UPI0022402D83|nr:cytochrome P460 family protein [Trichlorobacter lovleyi]QOX78789.1 cytochrome P460 family protein [Trichlorobacter lovleyi]
MKCTTLMTGLIVLFTVCCAAAAATAPQLPKYQSWKKSTRKVVSDKKSLFYGIHYIYADSKALKGYKAGNKFPEGSRIVVEHFNIKGDNSSVDGPKNMVVLMKKDKSQKNTGGWLYAGYTADGKPSRLDPVKNCFECHQKEVAGRDYVFSSGADF